MGREIDEGWIEEAVERYRQIEALQARFDKAIATVEVTVRSADGLVEVVVSADGTIRNVRIHGSLQNRTGESVARAVQEAVTAAADAAAWARRKLQAETFGDYRSLQ
ncbi:YbaB/EbfC family nucleoid-associated protein [Dactylosporangium vinaceum]|uniref:YbaB/EbfC family nucleoid-associated protein n=1 Tax=Dactylosporangium vinaceum TaxID=53362 RepID=A0ABV5M149_9ACTN|nr:YbaB/EbfC family nucleoid-associated protein [Dactylosporangium vinaceum]UAB97217.1 YbaB/EbfC family nucleoid-associated protein [Dactylosporangium vinaceum]